MRILVPAVLALSFLAIGCAPSARPEHSGRIVAADQVIDSPLWSEQERARPIAARLLHTSEFASAHLIRLQGAETPHTHDQHDLTVTMLSGSAVLHLGDSAFAVHPGDVMDIPHGTPHWAENVGTDASVVYAVFSPPYDGTDMHPLPQSGALSP
jgi:quercetin dioxygenase-like cupin family protein